MSPCASCVAGEWLMPNWHGQNTGQLHDSITVAFKAQSGTGEADERKLTAASVATSVGTTLCVEATSCYAKAMRRDTALQAIYRRLLAAVSHDAVIRVYDTAGNMIETHEHKGDFKDW